MAKKITWYPSPAKLNLFLHITGRYENGYHQLQSLFQLLDKGDDIGFEVTSNNDVKIAVQLPGVPEHENLVYRAAIALKVHAPLGTGCTLHINKRLPWAAALAADLQTLRRF